MRFSWFPGGSLSQKLNKGPAYALGLAIASVAIIGAFFLPQGPTPLIYVVAFVAGMGFSAQYVFPWSMIPDVLEVDQAQTGERHEGVYFGVNNFLGKLTGAIGIAASGWALKLYGYVSECGANSSRPIWHPLLLCHRPRDRLHGSSAPADLVSDYPAEPR